MSTPERVRALVEPLVADLHLDLYDLEYTGGVVRVTVDQPGGIGMDAIASLTRTLSRAFDEQDPIDGHFTLEVSSPGLERPLRTAAHFARAVGTEVSVKSRDERGSAVRRRGTVVAADDAGVQIDFDGRTEQLGYDDIVQARTVFEWGAPERKPRAGRQKKKKKKQEVAP